ncbi:Ubiquitin carboxyl-terminal hydrolase 3, partial [Blyttiomyces sp. JEL0837]
MSCSEGTPASSIAFKQRCGFLLDLIYFDEHRQEDAAEFMVNLLNRFAVETSIRLDTSTKVLNDNFFGNDSTIISDLFSMSMMYTRRCLHPQCHHQSSQTDSMAFPQLAIFPHPPEAAFSLKAGTRKSLHDMFRLETEGTEVIEEYKCARCCGKDDKRRARNQQGRAPLPPILVLTLKRFYNDDGGKWSRKVHTYVHFPIQGLDMKPFVSNELKAGATNPDHLKYDLFAVA